MKKHLFPELKTERLSLRRVQPSDWEMISYLRSDKTVNKLVKRPGAETKEKALAFITRTNNDIDTQKLYYWCICLKDTPEMIGSICLWNFSEDRKTAEIGYDLSPGFQGKGIMNEAMVKALEFGFSDLQLTLIEAFTHRENKSSRTLLERNRFVLNTERADKDDADNVIYETRVS